MKQNNIIYVVGFLILAVPAAAVNIKWMYPETHKLYYENIISKYPEAKDAIIFIYPVQFNGGRICGYNYMNNKILISSNGGCDFEMTLQHELKHKYFFKQSYKSQIKICNLIGHIKNDRKCWEDYATNY